MNGKPLRNEHDIRLHCGDATLRAIEDFRRRAASMMPIEMWRNGYSQYDNKHPWVQSAFEEVLNEGAHPTARKYLKVAAHGDLATEPHLIGRLTGVKNFVMGVPGYLQQYSIEGGMERLPRALQESLIGARLEFNSPVVCVEKNPDESYSLGFRQGREIARQGFDVIFVAAPHNCLNAIEWGAERLRRAMTSYIAYYNRPAHYLRVSVLFRKPFWRSLIADSSFMLDAFGGCCVYDEGARHDAGEYGALDWLLSGEGALSLVNLDDRTLIDRAIQSLPDELYAQAREHFIEGRAYRWVEVNAQPGGCPARDTRSAHLPEPSEHPGIFIVGGYLFDSTLNGVFESVNFATDLMRSRMPTLPLRLIAAA